MEDHSEQNNDRLLVAQFLRDRDEASFRVLYRRHTPALHLLALRMAGGSQPDAEDAVQEAWLRTIRTLPAFRWDSAFRTWLSGIVINCYREIVRRRFLLTEIKDNQQEPVSLAPDESGLESMLHKLSDGYREVLVLHDLEGFTHEEISGLLGIAAGTSKSQLSRARSTLRSWLESSANKKKASTSNAR